MRYFKFVLLAIFFILFIGQFVANILTLLLNVTNLYKYVFIAFNNGSYLFITAMGLVSGIVLHFFYKRYHAVMLQRPIYRTLKNVFIFMFLFYTLNGAQYMLLPNGEHSQAIFTLFDLPNFPGSFITQRGIAQHTGYISIPEQYLIGGRLVSALFWSIVFLAIIVMINLLKKYVSSRKIQ